MFSVCVSIMLDHLECTCNATRNTTVSNPIVSPTLFVYLTICDLVVNISTTNNYIDVNVCNSCFGQDKFGGVDSFTALTGSVVSPSLRAISLHMQTYLDDHIVCEMVSTCLSCLLLRQNNPCSTCDLVSLPLSLFAMSAHVSSSWFWYAADRKTMMYFNQQHSDISIHMSCNISVSCTSWHRDKCIVYMSIYIYFQIHEHPMKYSVNLPKSRTIFFHQPELFHCISHGLLCATVLPHAAQSSRLHVGKLRQSSAKVKY